MECAQTMADNSASFGSERFRLEVAQTSFPLHAVELVEKAVQTGYRQILAVGGDGTNNEVVNGIMRQKEVPSHAITYALLPIGTGNDWIRTHGIPKDVGEWLAMWKQAIPFSRMSDRWNMLQRKEGLTAILRILPDWLMMRMSFR
jgi:diacylglycerol kinase family enzyme